MPSQRAILIDLAKKKLNPAVPHKVLDRSGHLTKQVQKIDISVQPEPIPMMIDEIIEEPVVEPIESVDTQQNVIITDEEPLFVETVIEEPQIVEEQPHVEEAQVVEEETQPQQKRRGRKFNTRA